MAAEDNKPMTLTSQLILAVVTIVLGSLVGPVVFSGIIENYKDDDSLKLTQLEKYFIPAREAADDCLNRHNQLYLEYPLEAARQRQMLEGIQHLRSLPKEKNTYDFEKILLLLQESNLEKKKEIKALASEVKSCRQQVFFKLEALSIATGTFEQFTSAADKRADGLNKLDAHRRKMLEDKKIEENFEKIDAMDLIRNVTMASSPAEISTLIAETEQLLPTIEAYGMIMADVEQKAHSVELQFFGEIREVSGNSIDSRFRENFLEWFF